MMNAKRITVEVCGDCPCCSEHDHGSFEYHCTMRDEQEVNRHAPPPPNCPLRSRALSVALKPGV